MKQSFNILFFIVPLVFQSWSNNQYFWIEAGNDITMCESDNYVAVNAQATNYGFSEWSTSGDGFFMLPNELSTFYYPGPGDLFSGSVILYISIFTSDNNNLTDSLRLVIVKAPVSLTNTFASICENDICFVQGQSSYSISHAWTTTGDGYFTDPFSINSYYIPGNDDISSGSVDLCLISFPELPCTQPDISCLFLEISKIPIVDAGEDATICRYDNYQTLATVQNSQTLHWTTSGDGTFNNSGISNPLYEPGYYDEFTGIVVLTINVLPTFPCQIYVSDSLVLNILSPPQVHAGINQTICKNQIAFLSGSANNYTGVYWETYGDGTFSNDTILNPVYTPGPNDISVNRAFLEINALPLSPCTEIVGSFLFIELQTLPVVDAGEDVTVCGDSIILNGVAENYEEIAWTTNGDGTFRDNTNLNTAYFYGAQDISAGIIRLTLTAVPVLPCDSIKFDETVVTIDEPEIVNQCIQDTTLMTGQILTLHFEAESFTSGFYNWYFNGVEISGENSPFLIIPVVEPYHAGNYHCIYFHECGNLSSNICQVKIHEEFSQEFNLSAGWSGLSSFVIPDNSGLDTLFKNIMGNVILISDISGIYWPEHSINTLGTWLVPHGYQIKLQESSTLIMHGIIKYPVQEISVPPGWSLLPVNFDESVDVSVYFDTILGIEIIKEVAGIRIYWPGMNIRTLDYLIPGKAYLIFNKTFNNIPIDFSESLKKGIGRK